MTRVAVVGGGLMGCPIAYALDKLGFDVSLVEEDEFKLANTYSKIKSVGGKVDRQYSSYKSLHDIPKKVEVVVSAVPYIINPEIADYCVARGIRYCDLGGNPKVSDYINQHCTQDNHVTCVFTDLGLAPGWANIIAEEGCRQVNEPKNVKIRVGGLPVNPTGRLQYGRVFNVCGLRNEYMGETFVLRDGEIEALPTLTEEEIISDWDQDGVEFHPCYKSLEAFHTKGGLASSLELMKNRGVKNCDYKTLRYHGHLNYLKFLIEDCKLNDAQFESAMINSCPEINQDQVLIVVQVDAWSKVRHILHDEHWTAMQKATAFPVAAVAAIMAEGKLDHKKSLDYSDVPYEDFCDKLNAIDNLLV